MDNLSDFSSFCKSLDDVLNRFSLSTFLIIAQISLAPPTIVWCCAWCWRLKVNKLRQASHLQGAPSLSERQTWIRLLHKPQVIIHKPGASSLLPPDQIWPTACFFLQFPSQEWFLQFWRLKKNQKKNNVSWHVKLKCNSNLGIHK